MAAVQPVRGTKDLIGEDQRRHAHIVATARRVSGLYGFEEWQTPIFEDTSVFARSLGETSDVVTKEMYTFLDRGGDSLTLRPEGTAGVARALVSNGLTQTLPQKVFYNGPMFRYERPQRGRQRQFHQIGAELIGPSEPLADAEMIAMGWHILRELGVDDGVELEINTLGDKESRENYRTALVNYFTAHREVLSDDSQVRLEKNPMRILDSKNEEDKKIVVRAPTIEEFLSTGARNFYDNLKRNIDSFGVPYRENPRIVRGLDYYSHTAFEFVTNKLGAQGTVLAGGRYDGLVAEMGGPLTPAIGWAAGIERLAELIITPPGSTIRVAILPANQNSEEMAIWALQQIRNFRGKGLSAEIAYRGDLKRRMQRADKIGASWAVFVDALRSEGSQIIVRDLKTKEQTEMYTNGFLDFFEKMQGINF